MTLSITFAKRTKLLLNYISAIKQL